MVTNIPGAPGATGAAGADGTNGVDAYTATTNPFTMPAELGSVTVDVLSSLWMAIGQILFLGDPAAAAKGWFEVTAKPSTASVTLKNLADTANSAYLDNSAPGTVFPLSTAVSPGGEQGPPGVDGTSGAPTTSTYLTKTLDVTLPNSQALEFLATGLMKVTTGTGAVTSVPLGIAASNVAPVDSGAALTAGQVVSVVAGGLKSDTAANQRALLGFAATAIGTQLSSAVSITGGVITGITDLAVADGGTGGSTSTAAQDNLGKLLPRYGLLGSLTAVDMNVPTNDNAMTMRSSRYRIDKITVEAATISLTTATAGLFTAVGGGGTALAADQALAALTATSKFLDLTPGGSVATDVITSGTLYFRTGTAQGAPATANLWVFGWRYD